MMSLVVGNRGTRAALVAASASALAPAAIVPHVVEDAAVGALDLFGLGLLASGLVIGVLVTVQMLGALGAVREWRAGYVAILVPAAVWIVAALFDHPDAFVAGDFRTGLASRVAVWLLVGIQAVAALAAFSALRATRKRSFTGTGRYG